MKRVALLGAAGLVIVLLIAEVSLRLFFGLGSPPLVYESPKFAYAFRPDQSIKRFGHLVSYNEAGLRSEKLKALNGAMYRVLCVGGSVTNGGSPIDQDATYPYQLEEILNRQGQSVQVLNASATDWALGNEYGFLQDKGIFQARIVVFEVGTSDLYRSPAPLSAVKTDPNLPDHNPPTAIGELVERYLLPKIQHRLLDSSTEVKGVVSSEQMTTSDYERCLNTLKEMVSLVIGAGATPFLVLTPDRDEIGQGRARADHRNDLTALVAPANGALVDMLPVWQAQSSQGQEPLRDILHPSKEGNRTMAETVANAIMKR